MHPRVCVFVLHLQCEIGYFIKCLVTFYTNENRLVQCVILDHAILSLAVS
jgi:hypothetical protein